jgi:hypothetical protein
VALLNHLKLAAKENSLENVRAIEEAKSVPATAKNANAPAAVSATSLKLKSELRGRSRFAASTILPSPPLPWIYISLDAPTQRKLPSEYSLWPNLADVVVVAAFLATMSANFRADTSFWTLEPEFMTGLRPYHVKSGMLIWLAAVKRCRSSLEGNRNEVFICGSDVLPQCNILLEFLTKSSNSFLA